MGNSEGIPEKEMLLKTSPSLDRVVSARDELHFKLDGLADQYNTLVEKLPEVLTRDSFLELEVVRLEMEQGYRAFHELEMRSLMAIIGDIQARLTTNKLGCS